MTMQRIVALFVLGCVLAAPAGNRRAAAQTGVPPGASSVVRDLIDVAGANEPHTPAALNRGLAFRYALPGTQAP